MTMASAVLLVAMAGSGEVSNSIDLDAASKVFAEFEALCSAESTQLWGRQLCGPLMLVGPDGEIVANRAARSLEPVGDGLFRGRLPEGTPTGNTATEWQGIRWTQLRWPIRAGNEDRRVLLAHEAFHRIQPELGIDIAGADNSHLDSRDGRLWLRLEANALAEALGNATDWRTAARDALLFRAMRLGMFPTAQADECNLLRNEGLAEYTGVKVGGGANAERLAVERLRSVAERPSFVRTMGYIVGPGYGLLLDRTARHWRAAVADGGCMPETLEQAIGRSAGEALSRAEAYDLAVIAADEQRREERHRERLARYRATFTEGPVLRIPLVDMRISFNPSRTTPLPPLGTVYGTGRVQDVWGHVEVEGDFLLAADRESLRLPGPIATEAGKVTGAGWTLSPAPGWRVRPGDREGSFVLASEGS